MRRGLACTLAGLALLASAACNRADAPPPEQSAPAPLVLRTVLFGDAALSDAKLSPRGEFVAFRGWREGAPALFVRPTGGAAAADRLVAAVHGLKTYVWSADGRRLIYAVPGADGDLLSSVDVATTERLALTQSGHAVVIGRSPNDGANAIIAIAGSERAPPDLYRVNVATGARRLVERNAQGFSSYVVDRDNHPRLGLLATADGAVQVWSRPVDGGWRRLFEIPLDDTLASEVIAFEAGGRAFLMLDSVNRERAALVRVDAETGARNVLGESERADVVDVWRDPSSGEPEAFAANYLRREWRALDAGARADIAFLGRLVGEARVVSRTLDDKYWIVEEEGPTTPLRSYLYDRSNLSDLKLTLLFASRPALEGVALQPMVPVEIEARDRLTLVSYLTAPIGSDRDGDFRPDAPTPLVIIAHDGPWARASYGFDPLHQWLANRGYAALSVNFRGSTGFGRSFRAAGDNQWGAKMQDDLLDAAHWAVANRIAAPEQIAIMGEGYGGYAVLSALAAGDEPFACGVDVAGPSDLATLVSQGSNRTGWRRPALRRRVGDPDTAPGRTLLRARSPAFAGGIEQPLLIGQGGRDPFVARLHSDLIAQNARARRAGLVYVIYLEEARLFDRAPVRISFLAVAEQFLSGCLGGRAEPIGAAFAGVAALTGAGANLIDGLAEHAPPVTIARPQATPVRAPEKAPEENVVTPIRREERSGPPE
jgi:dipeptidyl aminopeptidase/acylaminoacyl peptidase